MADERRWAEDTLREAGATPEEIADTIVYGDWGSPAKHAVLRTGKWHDLLARAKNPNGSIQLLGNEGNAMPSYLPPSSSYPWVAARSGTAKRVGHHPIGELLKPPGTPVPVVNPGQPPYDGYKPHTGDFMPNRQAPGISNINTPVKTAAEERGQFGERRVQDAIERAPFDDPTVEQPQQPEQPQQGGVDMGAILAEKNRQRMMEIMNERMLANAAQINAIKPYAHYEVAPDPRQLGQDLITTGVRDFGKNIQSAMGQIGKTLNANADRVTAGKIAYAPAEVARIKVQGLRDIFNKLS